MILETERLILRPLELSDAPTLRELAGHPDIAATTLNIPHPYPEGAAEEFIKSLSKETRDPAYTFGMVRKTDTLLIGAIGIHSTMQFDRAEIGYWISVSYWGQGYTSEAARRVVAFGFETMNLHRIYATYLSHNIASRRVMEKAGMTYEGTLRQHVKRFDHYHDLGYCGILRDEWEAHRT